MLAHYFLEKYGSKRGLSLRTDFLQVLIKYDWPGNVRELENTIERVAVLCPTTEITKNCLQLLEQFTPTSASVAVSKPSSLEEIERQAIITALSVNDWNQTKAAQQLNIPRHVLIYRMKKFGISRL